jgi:uncharacterized protein (DUF433 family)
MVTKQYVEQREGGYWIAGTRVSLDSIVYAFLDGMSPESIVQAFPVLNLEEVYGAITFYLANRTEIDAYLETEEAVFESMRKAAREANPLLYKKLADAQMIRA